MDEHISGIIERVRFYNVHTGYVVLKVLKDNEEAVVVGYSNIKLYEGQFISVVGRFISHDKFGLQFLASDTITASLPQTVIGLVKWMSSGAIKGIGKVWAEKLVKHFGVDLLNIIYETPERLSELEGFTKKRQKILLEALQEQKQHIEVAAYMSSLGLGEKRIQSLIKKYGFNIVDILREKPYQLYRENRGIGFLLADSIATKNGLQLDSVERLSAGIEYTLEESASQGHCYINVIMLQEMLQELLGYSVDECKINDALLINQSILRESDRFFLKYIFVSEHLVAKHIKRLARVSVLDNMILKYIDALNNLLKSTNVTLTVEQIKAIELVLSNRVSVVTGGPGVGKTTVVRAILKTFEMFNKKVALAAPTGRAAKRLKESTGRNASTIHRLLKYDPATASFVYNDNNNLKIDVLILDELSMVDVTLMSSIVSSLPSGCFLIMVGDKDQLPSIGPGAVLADVIKSSAIPVGELTEIFRQARFSKIVQTAHNIRLGKMPISDDGSDCIWLKNEDSESSLIALEKLLVHDLNDYDKIRDVQVLTCMHKGKIGTRNLNQFIKNLLNPAEEYFAVGDKVIQMKNNYDKEVFNGDLGIIVNVLESEIRVAMDSGLTVSYIGDEVSELQLAYATTVHKSQGSEYAVVIVMLATEQFMLLNRHMLYTAVTRARKKLIIIGSNKAVALAVRNENPGLRRTMLSSLLECGYD